MGVEDGAGDMGMECWGTEEIEIGELEIGDTELWILEARTELSLELDAYNELRGCAELSADEGLTTVSSRGGRGAPS